MTVTRKPAAPAAPEELAAIADWYDTHSAAEDDAGWIEVEPATDPTVVRSVRLRRSTLERLSQAASARGVGPTELMRAWIEERLDAEASPDTERAKLVLLRGLADAMVREVGIPDLRVEISTGHALVTEIKAPTAPKAPKAVKAAPAKRTARKAAPMRKAAARTPMPARKAAPAAKRAASKKTR